VNHLVLLFLVSELLELFDDQDSSSEPNILENSQGFLEESLLIAQEVVDVHSVACAEVRFSCRARRKRGLAARFLSLKSHATAKLRVPRLHYLMEVLEVDQSELAEFMPPGAELANDDVVRDQLELNLILGANLPFVGAGEEGE